MARYVYVAVLPWGDNVVSLRLLRELRGLADLRILGTRLTAEVASALGFDAFPLDVMPTGVNACYDVRAAGPVRAVRDFLRLARALRAAAPAGTTVLFENPRRPATHRLLQAVGGGFRYAQPRRGTSAYADRSAMLQAALAVPIALPAALTPTTARRVLIAPAARMAFRAFPDELLATLLDHFARRGSETCLVDPDRRYAALHGRAAAIVAGQPLQASVAELRRADLVVAADSLFLHLAYALDRPVVALVPEAIARDFYFAPPGLQKGGLAASFAAVTGRERLDRYFDGLLPA